MATTTTDRRIWQKISRAVKKETSEGKQPPIYVNGIPTDGIEMLPMSVEVKNGRDRLIYEVHYLDTMNRTVNYSLKIEA